MIKYNPLLGSYLTISTPDIKNKVISLVLSNNKVIKVPFDYKDSLVKVKVKLRHDVYLTNAECLLYLQLKDELNLPQELILSIIVQYALNDEAIVHPKTNIISINSFNSHSIYLYKFLIYMIINGFIFFHYIFDETHHIMAY